ncbi:hypothetical protein Hanom_Chr08g00738351 [Helianthus anomalus]
MMTILSSKTVLFLVYVFGYVYQAMSQVFWIMYFCVLLTFAEFKSMVVIFISPETFIYYLDLAKCLKVPWILYIHGFLVAIRPNEKVQPVEIRVIKKWIRSLVTTKMMSYATSFLIYMVTTYICSKPRDYMATIDHVASLILGRKASFTPVADLDIPNVYFKFSTYEMLIDRVKSYKLLTGTYIN